MALAPVNTIAGYQTDNYLDTSAFIQETRDPELIDPFAADNPMMALEMMNPEAKKVTTSTTFRWYENGDWLQRMGGTLAAAAAGGSSVLTFSAVNGTPATNEYIRKDDLLLASDDAGTKLVVKSVTGTSTALVYRADGAAITGATTGSLNFTVYTNEQVEGAGARTTLFPPLREYTNVCSTIKESVVVNGSDKSEEFWAQNKDGSKYFTRLADIKAFQRLNYYKFGALFAGPAVAASVKGAGEILSRNTVGIEEQISGPVATGFSSTSGNKLDYFRTNISTQLVKAQSNKKYMILGGHLANQEWNDMLGGDSRFQDGGILYSGDADSKDLSFDFKSIKVDGFDYSFMPTNAFDKESGLGNSKRYSEGMFGLPIGAFVDSETGARSTALSTYYMEGREYMTEEQKPLQINGVDTHQIHAQSDCAAKLAGNITAWSMT